jgi:GWxTD domain-containing protein
MNCLLVGVLFLGLVGARDLRAQAEMRPALVSKGPVFFVDAISYLSDAEGKSRIDVYVQVPYEELRFVKGDDLYTAHCDVTLRLYDQGDRMEVERSWRDNIQVKDFQQTASGGLYRLTQKSIDVTPGTYRLEVLFRDEESDRQARFNRTLLVPDFRKDPVSISDIMLVNRMTTDGDRRTVVPNISGVLNDPVTESFVFFEIYHLPARDSVLLRWKLLDADRKELVRADRIEPTPAGKTQSFVHIKDIKLPAGNYFLTVEAWEAGKGEDGTGVPLAIASRSFSVRSSDLPNSITDLDKAIDQLRYIASGREIDSIREAPDPTQKKLRFLEFWQKRDPDPQTARNELMEEYYDRVDYANKHFSHYLEGWKTDMGMVFIRFGQPENVERHPFEYDTKPYEIWYYYQLNRQFIFVDETGFGDYRLRYPTTDLWGRIR